MQAVLLLLLLAAPAFIHFTEAGGGPGALHAPIFLSLAAGLLVGAMAQRTRLCMVGGIRDMLLFRDGRLLSGFIALFAAALVSNLVLGALTGASYFQLGFSGQPVAHTDGLWNGLGMLLAGFGCVLLGGCPLRQLILAGEGNTDSAIAVLGLLTGAAFSHNFGLASSTEAPPLGEKLPCSSVSPLWLSSPQRTHLKRRHNFMISIDARGLSCPEPVILIRNAMRSKEDAYEIVVDNPVSRENVTAVPVIRATRYM